MSDLTLGCYRSNWTHGEVEGRFRGLRVAFVYIGATIHVFVDTPTGVKAAAYPAPQGQPPSVEFLTDLAARTAA